MTLRPFRRTTRLHKTLSSDNMVFQHSGAVSAFGRRLRPLDTPPQTLQAKRRSMGSAGKGDRGDSERDVGAGADVQFHQRVFQQAHIGRDI